MEKIGAFRITIKGWSVTVVAAALVASNTIEKGQTAAIVSLLLVLLVVSFFTFEVEQVKLSLLYGGRAKVLESAIHSIDQGRKIPQIRVPSTAREIGRTSAERLQVESRLSRRELFLARARDYWDVGVHAHRWFYVILFTFTIFPILKNGGEIFRAIQQAVSFCGWVLQSVFSRLVGA